MSMLVCFAPGGFPGACHQIVNEQVAGGVPFETSSCDAGSNGWY